MRGVAALAALLALVLTLRAGERQDAAQAAARPALLVVTETAGYRHASIAAGLAELRRLQDREGVVVREVTRFADLTPEAYEQARGLVLLQTSGTPALDAAGRARLLAAVRGGLPLLAFHAATSTFPGWAAFHRMLGGSFRDHPNVGVGRVRVERRDHPATAALRSFRLREEWYRFRAAPDPRRTAHVLASLDVASVGGRPRGDRPLVWWRTEGEGRVVVSALGHAAATWRDPRHRLLVRGALDWALGRTP